MKLCSIAKLNCFVIELFLCIKMDLELNNLQCFICHKFKPSQTKPTSFNSKLNDLKRVDTM